MVIVCVPFHLISFHFKNKSIKIVVPSQSAPAETVDAVKNDAITERNKVFIVFIVVTIVVVFVTGFIVCSKVAG